MGVSDKSSWRLAEGGKGAFSPSAPCRGIHPEDILAQKKRAPRDQSRPEGTKKSSAEPWCGPICDQSSPSKSTTSVAPVG